MSQKNQVKQALKPVKKMVKAQVRSTVGEESKAVASLASYIAAPLSFPTERYPDTYSTFETSLSSPWTRVDALFPGNTSVLFLFRQALRAYIQLLMTNTTGVGTDVVGYGTHGVTFPGRNGFFGRLKTINPDLTLAKSPHGTYLYPGCIGDNYYYYCELGQQVTLTGFFTENTDITVRTYTPSGQFQFQVAIAGDPAEQTIQILQPEIGCYVSVAVPQGVVPPECELNVTSGGVTTEAFQIYSHHPIPGMDDLVNAISTVRITAVSGMYTNYASVLNLQGRAAALQAPGDSEWWDWTSFGKVASAQTSYTNTIKEGLYGFLKPNKSNDMDFKPVLLAENPCFDLMAENDFLVLLQDISNEDGREGFYTVGFGLEFRSASTWWPTDVERPSISVLNEVLPIVACMPQFHDNPIHLKDIAEFLKKVVNKVVQYGPSVLKTAGTIAALL